MNYDITNGVLSIILPERIDTSVSSQVSQEINSICEDHPHNALIIDASHLTYISSSGLRILLALAKKKTEMKIIGVNTEVYNVFDMTGFTRIINVERSIREVSIDGCAVIGVGGVGTVYQLSEDTIIKVFRSGTPLADVQKEIKLAREAFVFGMPTAISFEMVRVGEQYGLIHELINAKTLANVICENPDKAEHYGKMLGRLMKEVHSIKDNENKLPDAREETYRKLELLRKYFTDEQISVLKEIYDAIPVSNSILHCDLHPKNIMVSNGELILIDMGEVCHGNPLQDMAHTYSPMKKLVGNYEAIVGMTEEMSHFIYDTALREYFGTDDEAFLARKEEQISVASLIRNFSWLTLSDSFPDEVIEACKQTYIERVTNNLEQIRRVIKDFNEWA